MNIGTCSTCGQELLWCVTTNGRKMPINPDPVEYGGNIVIRYGLLHVLGKGEPSAAGEKRYRSHFATCRQAAQHRKPGEKKRPVKKTPVPTPTLFGETT